MILPVIQDTFQTRTDGQTEFMDESDLICVSVALFLALIHQIICPSH